MITCIITTYKRKVEILKRAVDSIINQTYKDIEIIIVNDAPAEKELSDNISRMIEGYGKDITYIIHDVNQGACAARNTGIAAAKGEYIAFLDDDDAWVENKLELQLKAMQDNDCVLVYGDFISIDANGDERIMKPCFDLVLGNNDYEKLLCFNYIGSTSFPLIRADVLKKVGGFNPELKSSQDHEVWLKILRNNNNKSVYIDKPMVKYFYSEVAITRSTTNREQGYKYIQEEFKEDYQKYPEVLHCRYILLSIVFFGMKNFKHGFAYWGKAVKLKPFTLKNLSIIKRFFNR